MHKFYLACLIMFSCVRPVSAVSVSILSSPASIGEDKFSITVKTEGATAGTNYLRADLYVDGSKNYFGETDNGQSWYGGSDGKQYLPITITTGVINIATVSARMGEPSLVDYPGPGNYKLRIRRYTGSGNQGSEDTQSVDINITRAWPSPTPSPILSPSPSPTPTPTPTSTPSPSPTPKPSLKPTPSPLPTPDLSPPPVGTVAGDSIEIDLSGFGLASPVASLPGDSRKAPVLNPRRAKTAIVIGTSLVLISLASYFGYRKYLTRPKP